MTCYTRIRRVAVALWLVVATLCAARAVATAEVGTWEIYKWTTPPEIARLARSLLTQIDLTYRFNRRTRDARMREVDRVLRAWHASARLPEDDERLLRWLQKSIRRSAPGQRGPFLPLPDFRHLDQASDRPVLDTPNVAAPARTSPAAPALVQLQTIPRTDSWLPSTTTSPPRRPDPVRLVSVVSISRSPPPAWAPKQVKPTIASLAAENLLALPHPNAIESTRVSPISSIIQNIPPVPMNREAGGASARVATARTDDAPPVRINREELVARLAGYSRGLRKIEAQLAAANPPSARKLAMLAQELDILAAQRDLLVLYCAALGGDAPSHETSLRTTATAWKYVRQAIDTRRHALAGTGQLLSAEERQIELSILAAIERRMVENQE